MISEHEYNEMLKAKRNADYLAMIDKSMKEAEDGGFILKNTTESESTDPFYSESNIRYLENIARDIKEDKAHFEEHHLIEVKQ